MTSLILSLVVEPSSLRARLQLPLSGSSGIFPDTVVAVTPNVRHHVERLVAAISHHLVTHEDGSVPILEDVVSAVGRDFSDPALTMDIVTSARPVDFRIRKALAFIKGSPVRNPTSAEVVAQVGLSRSRFFEHIRRCLEFRRISTSTGYGCRCHSTTGNE